MDRILKAEGKSPDEYKVSKQADTLMTFYNLKRKDVDEIFTGLEYSLPEDYLEKNLRYYLERTSHGSTLSRVVHAHLANMIDNKKLSWELYYNALTSDYQDIQGGTTGEGIHAGVMAGTVFVAINSFAGMSLGDNMINFEPKLPEHWRRISFRFGYKGRDYECEITKHRLRIKIEQDEDIRVQITYKGVIHTVMTNTWVEISEKFDENNPIEKSVFTC
jgi:trehalose/maltose hydrolase-like predicted phosphorylase